MLASARRFEFEGKREMGITVTGATFEQVELYAASTYEKAYRDRYWKEASERERAPFRSICASDARLLVPETHRIIALDDLMRVKYQLDNHGFINSPEDLALCDRIDALIAGDNAP